MNNQTQVEQLATGTQPMLQNDTGIDMGNLIDEFKLSKSYVEQYSKDFVQLDNLVDGVPISHDNDVPFVGDTTLAGLVRSIPRDSLEQLPVFSCLVNGTKISIAAFLCTYLLKKRVFNEDTFGKGLLATLQIGTEQALTHGYAPFMAASGAMYEDFGSTLRLLHFSDTSPEPGIQDANESGYHYVIAHLTASRVKKIRATAASNPNSSWNITALDLVLAAQPRATEYAKYQSVPRQNQAAEASSPSYEFVTRYETGKGGTVITFCPEVSEAPLRVLDNHSKWGYPKVMYLVIDPAALTPFGISRVRLASPNQNLMNIYYGNIAAMLLLNSKPPVFKRGRFTSAVALKQGVVWETLDPQADAKLMNLDNGSLQFFPQMAQQFAGQIQNIMGGRTQTTNAGSKSGFGKTAPGEKRAQEFQDAGTNQITKILENFLRQYAMVALDTLLSEQIGEDDMIVDDETKNSINEVAPGTIAEDSNTIHMAWEDFYAAIKEWSVEVTVSVSKDEMEAKKRADAQDMLTVLAQNADGLGPEAQQRVKELTDILMKDLAPTVKPLTLADGTDPAAAPAVDPKAAPPKTPAESITFKDAVAAGAIPAAAAMLNQAGLPSDGIHAPLPPTPAPAKAPAKVAVK